MIYKRLKGFIGRKLKKLLGLELETIEELRARGVVIGDNCHVYGKIDNGHGFLVTIGDNVIISDARILTHDASTKLWLGYSKIGRVTIGSRVFIGADAVILPNVTIGDDVIVGAGSVVARNIPNNSIVVGNPAKVIGTLDDYIQKNNNLLKNSFIGNKYWKDLTDEDIRFIKSSIIDGEWGFDQ